MQTCVQELWEFKVTRLLVKLPLAAHTPASRKIGPNITTHPTYQQKKHAAQLWFVGKHATALAIHGAPRQQHTVQTVCVVYVSCGVCLTPHANHNFAALRAANSAKARKKAHGIECDKHGIETSIHMGRNDLKAALRELQ